MLEDREAGYWDGPGETIAVRMERKGSRQGLVIRWMGEDMNDRLALRSMT